jgi:signal peptidase I
MVGEVRLHAINGEGSMTRCLSRQFLCRPLPLAIIGAVSILVLICASGVIYLGVTAVNYRAHTYKATGPAMEPTIHDGQLLTTQDYGKSTPQRSDIVIFHPHTDPSTLYFKRIIGLPGERVDVTDAAVLINGKPLQEPYLGPHFAGNGEGGVTQLTLEKDQYYVLGDNRQYSIDSRLFGAVSRSAITAKVVTISK